MGSHWLFPDIKTEVYKTPMEMRNVIRENLRELRVELENALDVNKTREERLKAFKKASSTIISLQWWIKEYIGSLELGE